MEQAGASGAVGHGVQGPAPLYACRPAYIANQLLRDQSYGTCQPVPGQTVAAAAACARGHIEQESPFVITWSVEGTSGARQGAIVGDLRLDGYTFYRIDYDSAGFVGPIHPDEPWTATWVECLSLTVTSSCNEIADCFACVESESRACGCGREDDPLAIHCGGFIASPTPE